MAFSAIDTDHAVEFTSQHDSEPKTVFLIGSLSGHDMFRFMANGTLQDNGKDSFKEVIVNHFEDLLLAGLRGIKNFNIKGTMRNFERKDITLDIVKKIPLAPAMEVAAKILQLSTNTESEIKN